MIYVLEELNQATSQFYVAHTGQKPTKLIISREMRSELKQLAWSTSYTKEYETSKRGRKEIAAMHEYIANGLCQIDAYEKVYKRTFFGYEIEVDHSLDAPLVRVK